MLLHTLVESVIPKLGLYPIEIFMQLGRSMFNLVLFNIVYSWKKKKSNLNVH